MKHIWRIFEPADQGEIGEDPFDIFVYSLTQDEPPYRGELIFIEGRNHRVVACAIDWNMTETQVRQDVRYYKVCVVPQ